MSLGRYQFKLRGRTPVPEPDTSVWMEWMEGTPVEERTVARTPMNGVEVVTMFVGLDRRFGSGAPLVFETTVVNGLEDDEAFRYSTWDEAENGHEHVVRLVEERRTGRVVVPKP